ncbi:UNVERIFIED_CONTAM: hypothetical protein PYX00_000409 [Menopon gallinae]|uniref:Transmembrane protein 94 n=1 Tax=Menopon gallinae TaxID=328185 RepID=A0AAW2IA59_9NEOP
MAGDGDIIGLSTKEGLLHLYNDLKSIIEVSKPLKMKLFHWKKSWLYDTLHHKSQYTTISWISALILIISAITLSMVYSFGSCRGCHSLPYEIFVIVFLVIFNLGIVGWDNKLRHGEIFTRAEQLLEILSKCKDTVSWNPSNYPHLCTPTSPCITLQWTYRDGKVVNLPWALLVKGDVIIIRPGQLSPGLCTPMDDSDGPILHANEVYSPPLTSNSESCTLPAARAPLENKKYLLQETPYLRNLKMALDQSLMKPVSYHNKERHLIMVTCIEQTAIPVLFMLTLFVNASRYFYLGQWVGRGTWIEMFIIQPISVILPLLPLIFPLYWFVLNAFGVTKIRANLQVHCAPTEVLDPFEDTDGEEKQPNMEYKYDEVKNYFIEVLLGKGPLLTRSVNILHVLGSVTALCCVDKKGILSWPNPTAEKVFFLTNSKQQSQSAESLNSEVFNNNATPKNSAQWHQVSDDADENLLHKTFMNDPSPLTVAEVLDLTHDHSSPFRLQFDDKSWEQYLSSLKPLGLAILLNTCNMDTQEHYTKFCSHITCEALHSENLVPVTNRRCLCELAKQIGFVDQAQDIFHLEEQLCTFKHMQPENVKRDIKFAKQLSISTKVKFPFPHMMATVLRDKQSGTLQLMSQGTADVILDSCVEYWDGHDLYPLTTADRKKIIDFYQRSSLTAYCTAFAYRPLTKAVNSKLSDIYLEIPADSKNLYLPHRSPTPLALSLVDSKWKGILAQFHSTDSLLNTECKEEEISDVEGCFDLQCNQVFIGMVTMQYQAQTDIVNLIEQLDRACIRFVHFSKENELRSRVFSEKMGLESGWNCHISLLSERNSTNLTSSRAMSFSAPSAINLEQSVVKFDEDTANLNWNDGATCCKSAGNSRYKRSSQDSVLVQGGDLTSLEPSRSLSCLTDSTDQSVPVNFDIWNRAKLPRGIDKIRPHLDMIDNVPLLVSLFTDCTPTVTREMLHIMQDYGEVVCVMGSSANYENIGIFMQADASIAVEPLYPQVCQKVPVVATPTPASGPSPIELSRTLNSLACAVSFRREDPFTIFNIIMEARHYTQCLMNCLQFWVCSVVALGLLQFLAAVFMLPPLFSIRQILFISCVLVPILSTSLVALPTNPQVMQKATGKNQCTINSEIAVFVFWCYGCKFIPSVITIILLYFLTLSCFCNDIAGITNTTCTVIYPNVNETKLIESLNDMSAFDAQLSDSWKGWYYFGYTLLSVQHLCAFVFVIHIGTSSISFVHREYSTWQRLPSSNHFWLITFFLVIMIQAIFSAIELYFASDNIISDAPVTFKFPTLLIAYIIFTIIVVFLTNEGIKYQEIKVNKRFQRRKRLDFGTKLGMNSPF